MPMWLLSSLRARLFGDADGPTPPAQEAMVIDEPDTIGSPDTIGTEDAATGLEAPVEPAREASDEPPTISETGENVRALQERTASRILEDERLRGDLTDDEFQPLLDWALRVSDRLAASTVGLSEADADARIDAGIQVVRDVVGAAGAAIAAHNEGDVDRRVSEFSYLASRWAEANLRDAAETDPNADTDWLGALIERLDASRDLSGAELAAIIVAGLEPARPQEGTLSQPEAAP
jgi:hypothetical protein